MDAAQSFDYFTALTAQARPGDLILDIGANVGGHTEILRRYLPSATLIHAFEPLTPLWTDLTTKYGGDPTVRVFKLGLSDVCGLVTGLAVHEAWTLDTPAHAAKGRNAYCREVLGLDTFDVVFTTVDHHVLWNGEGRRVSVLKIDTDGYEARVLRGAAETLARHRPAILLEIGYLIADVDGPGAVEAMLAGIYAAGYRLHDTVTGEPWTLAAITQTYPWHTTMDVLMLPEEAQP